MVQIVSGFSAFISSVRAGAVFVLPYAALATCLGQLRQEWQVHEGRIAGLGKCCFLPWSWVKPLLSGLGK